MSRWGVSNLTLQLVQVGDSKLVICFFLPKLGPPSVTQQFARFGSNRELQAWSMFCISTFNQRWLKLGYQPLQVLLQTWKSIDSCFLINIAVSLRFSPLKSQFLFHWEAWILYDILRMFHQLTNLCFSFNSFIFFSKIVSPRTEDEAACALDFKITSSFSVKSDALSSRLFGQNLCRRRATSCWTSSTVSVKNFTINTISLFGHTVY